MNLGVCTSRATRKERVSPVDIYTVNRPTPTLHTLRSAGTCARLEWFTVVMVVTGSLISSN